MFKCEIKTGNAAFGESKEEEGMEIARLLREIADDIANYGWTDGLCVDYNGNRVGNWSR